MEDSDRGKVGGSNAVGPVVEVKVDDEGTNEGPDVGSRLLEDVGWFVKKVVGS